MHSSVSPAIVFEGIVNRVVFRKTDGWGVLAVSDSTGKNVKLTGTLSEMPVNGATIHATGRWTKHHTFGHQFVAEQIEFTLPQSEDALVLYLVDTISGIGPVTARKLVSTFGSDVENALGDAARLVTEAGLRVGRATKIANQWMLREQQHEVPIFLRELGLGHSHVAKAIGKFGAEHVRKIVTHNPYRLTEISGIGFISADAAATKLGMESTASFRIRAGIYYALETRSAEGHTATSPEKLIEVASQLLMVDREIIASHLDQAVNERLLARRASISGETMFLLPQLDERERSVARDIQRIMRQKRPEVTVPTQAQIKAEFGFEPDPSQYSAIQMALTQGLLIITGGPGTGKTTLLRIILALFRRLFSKNTWVVAQTGRAAKRVKEATGEEATTVHRFLGVKPGGPEGFSFVHDRNNQLKIGGDLLTTEETSLFDINLMASLLAAVPEQTPVIIVGDVDQLPSVGPGNVLADLIASGVPTIRLTTIHRNEAGSMIPLTALQIRAGNAPRLTNKGDVRGVAAKDPDAVCTEIKAMLAKGIVLDDIGILSPMKKGPMGTDWLNIEIQKNINAGGLARGAVSNGRKIDVPGGGVMNEAIAVGDRVMQTTKNDYDLDIYNGDLFVVTAISNQANKERWLDLRRLDDGFEIRIPSDKLFDIRLAYAMTIHKSQGSQYPHVILVLMAAHLRMLYRRLLNTGWTRPMKTLVIVGESRAIDLACQDVGAVAERQTGLLDLLVAA